MKKILNIYLYYMINNDEKIENGMMDYRNENDIVEDDGRVVKNYERLFKENIKDVKYKKETRFYAIHEGDYNRKSDPNLHTKLFFDASPRPGDA